MAPALIKAVIAFRLLARSWLSKCSTLPRTTSFLSDSAAIFNPSLKIILLNKPDHNESCGLSP